MMNAFEIFENHIKVIDSMVKAINHIIRMIQDLERISTNIELTLKNILEFLSKAINTIPRVLLLPYNHSAIKDIVLTSFDKVQHQLNDLNNNKHEFIKSWDEFFFWWKEFLAIVEKSKENSRAFYLIMN